MRFKQLASSLAALAVAACSPSTGQEKGHGGPGGGMPPPEVNVVRLAPRSLPVELEYVGQTAG